MVTFLPYYINIFLPSLVYLSACPALLCLPIGVVLYDVAQCMNAAKGSPSLTVASNDHRGYWRGVTLIGSLPLSCRCHHDVLESRPEVLSILGFS
jgi:hypothetical protein